MLSAAQQTREILALCRDLGFALSGVCPAAPSRWEAELRAWFDAGRHGSMDYLARNIDERLDPARLLPGARSIIMVADLYHEPGRASEGVVDTSTNGDCCSETRRPRGRIARYARGRDYHVVIKKRLHALCDALRNRHGDAGFRAFVDTAPVLEREHAARAAIGWVGKHTLIINPRLGSYMLLGGVLTTLDLEPAPEQEAITDHCGTCTRCIDACPTGAITPYSVDATRCISYLTIERRGPIDPRFHEAIGDRLFGCDVCQDVCPHNRERPADGADGANGPDRAGASPTREEYRPRHASFDLLDVLGWTPEDRSRELLGSAMKRATLAMLKRNALILLGNALTRRPDPDLAERVRRVSEDESEPELVRRTAHEVAGRIRHRLGSADAPAAPPRGPAPATTPRAR